MLFFPLTIYTLVPRIYGGNRRKLSHQSSFHSPSGSHPKHASERCRTEQRNVEGLWQRLLQARGLGRSQGGIREVGPSYAL